MKKEQCYSQDFQYLHHKTLIYFLIIRIKTDQQYNIIKYYYSNKIQNKDSQSFIFNKLYPMLKVLQEQWPLGKSFLFIESYCQIREVRLSFCYILQMIINSILSLVFLWSWKKCHLQLKQLQKLRRVITSTPIESVSQAIKRMQNTTHGQKIFVIIKGLLKMKVKLRGEKSIYSLIDLSQIRQGRLGDHFLKKSWEQLAQKAYWKQPHNTKKLEFSIQDMANPNQKITVRGCKEANISGALNELYNDRTIMPQSPNIFVRSVIRIYNFFVSRAPLSFIFNPTKIGEQLTLYGIQDNQFSLVIGQLEKDSATNEVLFKSPQYITKQRSYIQSKLLKKEKRLMLIAVLLTSLLAITGIKFIRKLYDYVKKWQIRRIKEDEQQIRSEDQGDNCNCIVCYQNVRNIVFKPCLHYAVCKACFKLLPRSVCPYCKEAIQDTIQIVKRK